MVSRAIRILGALCGLLILDGCATKHPLTRTLALPADNPTSWVFQLPIEKLQDHIYDQFMLSGMTRFPDYAPWPRYQKQPGGSVADLWKDMRPMRPGRYQTEPLFEDPANSHDIVINEIFGVDTPSPVYCGPDGALLYWAKYHFHLESVDPTATRVSVRVLSPRVLVEIGKFGWHGTPVETLNVAPTTIEEYKLLRFIGATLGVDMPPAQMPVEACDDAL